MLLARSAHHASSGAFVAGVLVVLAAVALLPSTAGAQALEVSAEAKISDTQGGLAHALTDTDHFGESVASIGDLDGDTVPDLVVGINNDDTAGTNQGSLVVLFMNANGTVKAEQQIAEGVGGFSDSTAGSAKFGASVANIGDLDGDTVTDLIVGGSGLDDGGTNRGAVWILFMNTNGTVKAHQRISDTAGGFAGVLDDDDRFGIAVSGLGDLDGDSVEDVVVGALYDDDGGANRGAVWILFLNTNGTVKAYQKISSTAGGFFGTLTNDGEFGVSVAAIGDVDGDSVPDLAVGNVLDDDGAADAGAVWIIFLNADGTVKLERKISATSGTFGGTLDSADRFGRSVAKLGDMDGDTVPDLAVGAVNDDDGAGDAGAVWVLFLNTNGTVKAEQKFSATVGGFSGPLDANDRFGASIASIGDLDSNGVSDLAVGARVDDDGGTDRGAVWILSLAVPGSCGNSTLDGPEECDDGNTVGGDCCAADCTFELVGSACTDDANGCTDDQCDATGTCVYSNNVAACDDGVYCNGGDTCGGGACTVHAGDPCIGADGDGDCSESCDEAADNCLAPDLNGSVCDDGQFCNGADTCSAGACSVSAGDPCIGADGDGDCSESCDEAADNCLAPDPDATVCDDGQFCNGADTCSAGACSVSAGDPCIGADGDGDCSESCDEAADNCLAPDLNGSVCDDGTFCNGADTCSAGACSVNAGDPCIGADGDGDCSESCDEAADNCLAADPDATVCDDGQFCNGADTCSAGACSVSAGDPCIGADGDGDCSESCDEAADNCLAPDLNGSLCDDGTFCNGADTCSAGACSVNAGDPCIGADGDGDCSESCDEAADNCLAPDLNGSVCDDGTFCNGADTCSAGACSVNAGDPCIGADGDGDCSESCDEAADNCLAPDPDATVCDDGQFCNGADTCSAGACSVNAGDPCIGADGDGDCSESCDEAADNCLGPDPDATVCDDGQFCNGADTCSAGACSVNAGDPCIGADGDGDCSESCDEAADNCLAPDLNGSVCDDGTFCNGADTCSAGACSVNAGDPCIGADGDGDCSESCDEAADNCLAPDPDATVCDDGQFCNGADTCSAGACSVNAGDPCIGADGDGDCSESCDEAADNCLGPDPDATVCDDGQFCNGADTCSAGACSVNVGDPCAGPDGDGDCAESCDEAADNCLAPDPDATVCDDGTFCNGADTCSAGSCSVSAGDPCPGADGDGDCSETCDEAADNCLAPDLNGSVCDDGTFCNGADTCSAGACSVSAGDPCIGADGDGDCSESCDEAADNCLGPDPDATVCDDGQFCNGADTCSAGACSVSAGDPCIGADGDGDCAESCDEAADNCLGPDPDATVCDDGQFCNGADTCSAGACSVSAGDPCIGADGDGDCSESCDEGADNCLAPDLNGSVCDDGTFCNGADTCSAGACSVSAGDPCIGADGDGDCSESCDEAADNCLGPDPDATVCDDGQFCNGADTCSAGACSVNAGDPCIGADGDGDCSESCDEAADNCLAPDPDATVCDDGQFCNGADTCSAGACSVNAGDPCIGADGDGDCSESCDEGADNCLGPDPDASICDDGQFCNGADTCSAGACSVNAGDPCAGADGDGDCSESCDEAADNCLAPDPDATVCDDGQFCNGADTCSAGACSVSAGDPCIGADGDGDCSESCDEAADNCLAPDPDATVCDDGAFCNGTDTCSAGACSVSTGDPCLGPDGDGDCAESCDEGADNCLAPDPNGAACDDGTFCNGTDTCSAGACSVSTGDPCLGPDGDGDCAESCDEAADNCLAPDPNGAACDDGTYCNGTDTCSAGACSVSSGDPCPGVDGDGDCSESCDEAADNCLAADPDASLCDDGTYCNGTDTCGGGACSVHAGDPCPGPDGDADCSESCWEVAQNCNDFDPVGSFCDDGQFCNGADTCGGGSVCDQHAGDPCPGVDGDGDCAETCDEAADNCLAADPDASVCDDGQFCNGTDTCSAGACSVNAGDPCSGPDGDGDCAETCDETADNCLGPDPDATVCDDGQFCNGADTCSGGACSVNAGDPCPGLDADGDCSESCDEAADNCLAPDPDASVCDDGQFCNGADTCSAGACSVNAGDPCSGPDGDGDCAESCDEAADDCLAPDPDDAVCDDGTFCNGADTCSAGACSVNAGDPCSGPDGDGDCAESCDETADDCLAPDPDASVCDDGQFCNGADTCSVGACSVNAGAPCPGLDGDGNCAESCDEAADNCLAPDLDGSVCDDATFCNGADTCSAGACSVNAGDPCAGADGDGDCAESCDEIADNCLAPDVDGTVCDDGQFCNGADTCSGGACSVSIGDPCVGGGQCADTCDEVLDTCNLPDGTLCDDGLFCTESDLCLTGVCEGGPNPCGESGTCSQTCNETEQVCKGCGQPFSNSSCMTNALVTLQTAVALATCEPCLCDVDGSGVVGATDALVVLHWCVDIRPQPDQCPELASLLTWGSSTTTTLVTIPSSSTTTLSTTSTSL